MDSKRRTRDHMAEMQQIIAAENSDLFDVLAFVAFALPPVTRQARADQAKTKSMTGLRPSKRPSSSLSWVSTSPKALTNSTSKSCPPCFGSSTAAPSQTPLPN